MFDLGEDETECCQSLPTEATSGRSIKSLPLGITGMDVKETKTPGDPGQSAFQAGPREARDLPGA